MWPLYTPKSLAALDSHVRQIVVVVKNRSNL